MNMILERKKRCIGHILRDNGLLSVIMDGRSDGKRPRRTKRAMMFDSIRGGNSYTELKSKARNKEVWKHYMP